MWDAAGFRRKAVLYFQRAEDSSDDDTVTALWCGMGLEFLLRAPLAQVNPVLLADPVVGDGYSALHAAGLKPSDNREPVSIKTKTVIERLVTVLPEFGPEDKKDAQFLIGLRNQELHTSELAYAGLPDFAWLPKFLRLIRKLSEFFGESPEDYLSTQFLAHAERLVDAEDRKVRHAVSTAINSHRSIAENLTEEEKKARRQNGLTAGFNSLSVECPACANTCWLRGDRLRLGRETLDGDMVKQRIYFVASKFECPVCNLTLTGVAEIAAAGLPQSFTLEIEELLIDRFEFEPEGPEYGND
ncbi:hypothetical protein PV458_18960 [Streptomyces sp. MN03-5084-2B]|nr:hypothetical protein [Streptomyces sp. MN03-5084-2B]